MNKRMGTKTRIALLSLVFGLLSLAGCGSGETSGTDAAAEFVGTWQIVEMEEGGETMSADDLALMKEMGLHITLVLAEDKKATLDVFGEAKEGTWSVKDASSSSLTFDGETIDAKLTDGKLALEQEGAKLFFEKTGAAPSSSGGAEAAPSTTTGADGQVEEVSVKSDYYGFDVTTKLPKSGWVWMHTGNTAYFYNEPTEEDTNSSSPRIQVEVHQTEAERDIYVKDYENPKDIDNRTISGIDMAGRTYKLFGMDWVEYYGTLDDTHFIAVKISDVDVDSGEGKDILDNVRISLL